MTPKHTWSHGVLVLGVLVVFFAAPHLIDDFLYGIPAEFGLTDQLAQVLAGIFHAQLALILVLVARERKAGYFGSLFWGIFLTLAGILKHVPEILKPEPYWSGLFSEALILGLILASSALAAVSLFALRNLPALPAVKPGNHPPTP